MRFGSRNKPEPRLNRVDPGVYCSAMRWITITCLALLAAAPLADDPSPMQADQKDPSKPPKIYVVPFGIGANGQVGTDIHSWIYEKVVKDIKAKKPDLIILKLESWDKPRRDWLDDRKSREELGRLNAEDARETRRMFAVDVGDIPQVMWVQDCVGFGTAFALAWPHMYTKSDARLWGLSRVNEYTQHPDHEVQRKFEAAFIGIVNGFLEQGGHPAELGVAMIRPEKKLSVSFKGRELEWHADNDGQILVDGDEARVANFDARLAEDLGLSRGNADSISDLMFQLGYREWDDSLNTSGQDGEKIVGDYIKGWRAAWAESLKAWGEYELNAGGDGKGVAKAIKALEQVKSAMGRYPVVEDRWKGRGVDRLAVEGLIKRLRERMKNTSGSGGAGGSSGGKGR